MTLWSGVLHDLHSDYLAAILRTTNNPGPHVLGRIFYWPELLLAWSWDAGLTARLNSLIRVGSIVYCVVWISRLVAISLRVASLRISFGTVIFCAMWSWWWPELGDSLVYSGTSLGVFTLLVTLGDPSGLARRLSLRWFWLALAVATFVSASTYVHSLLVVIPLLLYLIFLNQAAERNFLWLVRDRLLLIFGIAIGVGVAVLRLSLLADEETGLSTFGLLTKLRSTRHLWDGNLYLWDSLQVSCALALLSLAIAVVLRHQTFGALVIVGLTITFGVVPIVALKHVQLNWMMPRYFATTLMMGLLLQSLTLFAGGMLLWWRYRPKAQPRCTAVSLPKRVEFALIFGWGVIMTGLLTSNLGFGLNYRDQSNNLKAGTSFSEETISQLERFRQGYNEPLFVFIDYWNLYPSIFRLQEAGVETLALEGVPIFDVQQAGFKKALDSRRFAIICDRRNSPCEENIRNVLESRGLRNIEVVKVSDLSDTEMGNLELFTVRDREPELRYHTSQGQ